MARYDLRLSGHEFGRLTYRTFNALMARHNEERKAADLRAGQICACIAATVPRKGHPAHPWDFFPSLREYDRRQTPQEMLALMQFITERQNAVVEAERE